MAQNPGNLDVQPLQQELLRQPAQGQATTPDDPCWPICIDVKSAADVQGLKVTPHEQRRPVASKAATQRFPRRVVDWRAPSTAILVCFPLVLAALQSMPAEDGWLPWMVCPLLGCFQEYQLRAALVIFALTFPAKMLLDVVMEYLMGRVLACKTMVQHGAGARIRPLEQFETIDAVFSWSNTFFEFVGASHVIAFLVGPLTAKSLSELGAANGPFAFQVCFMLHECVYYAFHWAFHLRSLYPLVHKHHHRQIAPFRGLNDATNESPVEQIVGIGIFLLSLYGTACSVGLHAATAWTIFACWTFVNQLNHMAYNTNIHLPLLFPAFPRDHQMHHRKGRCNYAIFSMLFDRVFRTYVPYEAAGTPDAGDAAHTSALQTSVLNAAAPNPWAFMALAAVLPAAGLTIEVASTASLPAVGAQEPWLVAPFVTCGACALLCGAFRSLASASASSAKQPFLHRCFS